MPSPLLRTFLLFFFSHPPTSPPLLPLLIHDSSSRMSSYSRMLEVTMLKKYGPENLAAHYGEFDTICDATQVLITAFILNLQPQQPIPPPIHSIHLERPLRYVHVRS